MLCASSLGGHALQIMELPLTDEELQWARRVLAVLKPRERVPEPVDYGDYSEAALAAINDKIQAPHRPGGQIKRRPRWSVDEAPWGGWRVVVPPTLPVSKPVNPKPRQYDADINDWIEKNGVTRGRSCSRRSARPISEERLAASVAESMGLDWNGMTAGERRGWIRRIKRIGQQENS
jgi:hypothetical protein